jgi:hypothetical protein
MGMEALPGRGADPGNKSFMNRQVVVQETSERVLSRTLDPAELEVPNLAARFHRAVAVRPAGGAGAPLDPPDWHIPVGKLLLYPFSTLPEPTFVLFMTEIPVLRPEPAARVLLLIQALDAFTDSPTPGPPTVVPLIVTLLSCPKRKASKLLIKIWTFPFPVTVQLLKLLY